MSATMDGLHPEIPAFARSSETVEPVTLESTTDLSHRRARVACRQEDAPA
jgi:hypothetical protein